MILPDALIGYTGFVGTTLRRQRLFQSGYRSTDIQEIRGKSFDLVVCAGAPAQKWIANRDPAADREKIGGLMGHLDTIQCKTFVLISTVDVFRHPVGVDENSPVEEAGLQAYGLHRRELEKFVQERFPNHLVVRLPGLVGPGLRKNVIFDFLNDNNLKAIDSRGVFQFYPMVNLWYDIRTALDAGLKLIHLTSEPISVEEISRLGFGRPFGNQLDAPVAGYDMRTCHSSHFGASSPYQYSRRDTLQAVRAYAQSEAPSLPKVSTP